MAEAISTTRRSIFAAAPVLALAAAVPAALAESLPSAVPFGPQGASLLRRHEQSVAERKRLDAKRGVTDEEIDAWSDSDEAILDQIEALPLNRDGMFFRTRALMELMRGNPEQLLSYEGLTTDVRIALQIAATVARAA